MAAIIAAGVQGAVAGRALYADGSYYLWGILQAQGFFIFDPARAFAQFVTQIPIVLGMAVGIDHVPTLVILLGLGVSTLPFLLWALALFIARTSVVFWPLVVIFAAAYLNSAFVSIGEYTLAYALVAVSFAVISRDEFTAIHAVVLLSSAIILVRCYEAMAYLGPVLVVLCFVTLGRVHNGTSTRRFRSTIMWVAIAIFLLSTVLAVGAVIGARDPANRSGAADLLGPLALNDQLVISAIVALLFLLVAYFSSGIVRSTALGLLFAVTSLMLLPTIWAQPWLHYASRTITGLMMAGLIVVTVVATHLNSKRRVGLSAAHWLVPLALLFAQLVPFTSHTAGYSWWLSQFQTVLFSGSGNVQMEQTVLAQRSFDYVWPWTNPFLSVLLRPGGSETVVLSPGEVSDPTPDAPAELPTRFTTGPLYF